MAGFQDKKSAPSKIARMHLRRICSAEKEISERLDAIHSATVRGESCAALREILSHLKAAAELLAVTQRREEPRFEAG